MIDHEPTTEDLAAADACLMIEAITNGGGRTYRLRDAIARAIAKARAEERDRRETARIEMSTYCTKQIFGGNRATVGDIVLLSCARYDGAPGVCLRAGVVAGICSSKDLPYLLALGTNETMLTEWTFQETHTEKETEALPVGRWTWKPTLYYQD